MSGYKTDQHHLIHRGREFHFVSYEARDANPRTGEAAMPATWFLMSAGKRWPVMTELPDQDSKRVIAALTVWLDHHVFISPHA
jgi:hypothetical protein